jgi:hypothetical protein
MRFGNDTWPIKRPWVVAGMTSHLTSQFVVTAVARHIALRQRTEAIGD